MKALVYFHEEHREEGREVWISLLSTSSAYFLMLWGLMEIVYVTYWHRWGMYCHWAPLWLSSSSINWFFLLWTLFYSVDLFIYTCPGIRSDQISRSVMSNSLRPHESHHARLPCPSPTPGVGDGQGGLACWDSLSITNSRSSLRLNVHRVSDAIQPSHPLSSPSPPAPNPSQHQSLFQWVNSSSEVAKVLEFQL